MKKILLLLLIFISLENISIAQKTADRPNQSGDKENRGHKRKKILTETLQLTNEQQKKIKALHEEFKVKRAELEKNQNITLKEFNDRKTALRNDMKMKRESILTPEQKVKMAELKQRNEEKRVANQKIRLDKMKKTLSLTDDQTAKLDALQNQIKKSVAEIKDNKMLNDQEKKLQIKALKQKQKKEMDSILTEEQKKKLPELKKKHKKKV